MARKKLETTTPTRESLDTLLKQYYTDKKNADELKKKVEVVNKDIKEIMVNDDSLLEDKELSDEKKKYGKRSYTVDGLTANYTVEERKSLDEDGLIMFLDKNGYTKALKEVLRLDEEALERMIYSGEISKEHQLEIAKFEQIQYIPKLKVTKKKGD